ncbi:hypothetical protein HB976_07620 [Yersinia mollaretii]|uniref:hypothetical protein n=1 Tax=Yersinia mollaretii TaxID=33060 RepID=UPI000C1E4302|nr:hypothetical protein [Yersinia mollaretii]MDA5534907.1 hypothetical protein [Yersinia mollaretii]NIL02824.1 hypothetical protein [Yersinia mollaretii]PJE86948.1 hypothetical protein CU280_15620 [Yersinia mollaretii]
MNKPLPHDASESIRGTIYQFYHVIKSCSCLLEGQKIYIEKFGDITISDSIQIEVKKYKDDLSDSHENLWKTIKNWLDNSFKLELYHSLLLVTTQDFSKNSSISEWNKSTKEDKLESLKKIQKSANRNFINSKKNIESKNLQLINQVLSPKNSERLTIILSKFKILNCQLMPEEQYNEIVTTATPGIVKTKKELYIQNLLGYILSPKISFNKTGWEITYEDLEKQREILYKLYCQDSIIFPTTHINKAKKEDHSGNYNNNLYVKKIQEINYSEVIEKAKRDFIAAKNTICEEFSCGIYYQKLIDYENTLLERFEMQFRQKKRHLTNIKIHAQCQDFYDSIHLEASIPIDGFSYIPPEFKNGIIHMHMDDEDKNLTWNFS